MAKQAKTPKGDEQSGFGPGDVKALGQLKAVAKMLRPLRDVGTERDQAGNRALHMDDYCLLILMAMFNPVINSMRGIQQASEFENVRKRLGVGRASLGSLSESVRVFDPDVLAGIVAEAAAKMPSAEAGRHEPDRLRDTLAGHTLTAVDGSVFKVLAQIGQLAPVQINDPGAGRWRQRQSGLWLSAARPVRGLSRRPQPTRPDALQASRAGRRTGRAA